MMPKIVGHQTKYADGDEEKYDDHGLPMGEHGRSCGSRGQ